MKRIVVCCDGTWNSTDRQSENTNVFRIAKAVHATQGTDAMQIVLYLRGVGTSGFAIERWVEGAIGLGVEDNIRSAYMFIAQNYVPGDEIFIFGFSRGAFTARSLVGFISACGLLYRQSLDAIGDAWSYYKGLPPHSPKAFLEQFEGSRTHSDVRIKMLGVWDTVGSLGVPGHIMAALNERRFAFHDTRPSPIVERGYHALAIDEHRSTFVPTLWTGEQPVDTEIQQVWFAGAHADVGGGYVTRELADIPLVWMALKAEAAGLKLDWTCLPDKGRLDAKAASHDSSQGLFALARFHPTYRVIADRQCDVSAFEVAYRPIEEDGEPAKTINQYIHRTVLERYHQLASTCSDDKGKVCGLERYEARNLVPFFDRDQPKSLALFTD